MEKNGSNPDFLRPRAAVADAVRTDRGAELDRSRRPAVHKLYTYLSPELDIAINSLSYFEDINLIISSHNFA